LFNIPFIILSITFKIIAKINVNKNYVILFRLRLINLIFQKVNILIIIFSNSEKCFGGIYEKI